MSKPDIDVIIPSYNRRGLTLEAIDSVLAQSGSLKISIIIIEDGSDLLKEESFAKNVQYIRLKTNHGPSYCRNLGAKTGKAPYLAFLDSDDLWLPQKLAKQYSLLENNSSLEWCHNNESWLRNGVLAKQKKQHRKQAGQFVERLFERCLISPSAVMFRKTFFEKHGGFLSHLRVAEDYELWLRLNYDAAIGFLEEPLTIKRAGDWPQLSSTIGIDHYRVLALHRFWRLYHSQPNFQKYQKIWFTEINKKLNILIKGAEKFDKPALALKYRNWQEAILRINAAP